MVISIAHRDHDLLNRCGRVSGCNTQGYGMMGDMSNHLLGPRSGTPYHLGTADRPTSRSRKRLAFNMFRGRACPDAN